MEAIEISAARIVMEKIGLLRSEEMRAAADGVSKESPSSLNQQGVATVENRRNSLLVSALMDDASEFQSADALRPIEHVTGQQPSDLSMHETNEGISISIMSLPVLAVLRDKTKTRYIFIVVVFCCASSQLKWTIIVNQYLQVMVIVARQKLPNPFA